MTGVQRLKEGWMRVAKRIGDLQARAFLTLFYFVILGPFALVVRLSSDPLAIRVRTRGGWRLKGEEPATRMERASRQF